MPNKYHKKNKFKWFFNADALHWVMPEDPIVPPNKFTLAPP
jgi:hypothetical protein